MKKNLLWAAAFGLLMSASLVSCDDDDPVIDNPDNPDDPNTPPTEEVVTTNGYYVLNSGKMGSNNASLSFYNTDTQEVTADVFMEKNERGLGDTANDMLIYGEKMYIALLFQEMFVWANRQVMDFRFIYMTQNQRGQRVMNYWQKK